ncbi:glutaminyl-peptide cyclotransferase [Saccharopolyspora sp. WRP15-2]|uniref:Glutaminyl-peptide cyclotransferase n=1 Tax=Saccharopolyspora oryzae TaxID=2997343 RepID=A0ABT4VA17_9PSEU|nr:glutaminyl-peptide cyclotransferase [Saccharopolyspora oryzae]MDA3630815.1 glutaminyl-peptide cyclotransferase [Saccharopolyspora oryzae]
MLGLGLAACAPVVPAQHDGQHDGEQTDQGVGHAGSLPHLRAEVIRVLPHDRSSFTQGLEISGGTLYEGTGLKGGSLVRATDLATGEVRREVRLPADLFGEGITVTGDRIWQLTWQEEVALERDRETLAELRRVEYSGEGWGLCADGSRLVMSDGSDRLTFRDPVTFAPTGSVAVRAAGAPVADLNELECVDGHVWANVWHTEEIVRIDPANGQVTAVVDASGLLSPGERAGTDVLNGIAAVPGTDEFLLTGKYWPSIFRVRFVPA